MAAFCWKTAFSVNGSMLSRKINVSRLTSNFYIRQFSTKIHSATSVSTTNEPSSEKSNQSLRQRIAAALKRIEFFKRYSDRNDLADPSEKVRPVYRYHFVSRLDVTRSIRFGYVIAFVQITGWLLNSQGLYDYCGKYPWECIGCFIAFTSYSAFIGYMSRTQVFAIYIRDSARHLKARLAAVPGKSVPPEFILTYVQARTGTLKRMEFDFKDIQTYENEEIDSLPLWRRLRHRFDPSSPNIRIKGHWFRLFPQHFIDGDVHIKFFSTAPAVQLFKKQHKL